MNKEEEIEKMMRSVEERKRIVCVDAYNTAIFLHGIMAELVDAGYRKAGEVRDRTLKEVLSVLQALYKQAANISRKDVIYKIGAVDALQNAIDMICKEYGVKVDE